MDAEVSHSVPLVSVSGQRLLEFALPGQNVAKLQPTFFRLPSGASAVLARLGETLLVRSGGA